MASEEWLLPNPAQSEGLVGSRVAVLLTQPSGDPELLGAVALAVCGAGGVLAQATRARREAPRSDVFNMNMAMAVSFRAHRRPQRASAASVHRVFRLVARLRAQVECAAHQKGS